MNWCDWWENEEFGWWCECQLQCGGQLCYPADCWTDQLFLHISCRQGNGWKGGGGAVFVGSELGTEAVLVQRYGMWKILVVCRFSRMFFFSGWNTQESKWNIGIREGKLLSLVHIFFNLTLCQQIGNNECKSIPQHLQMHFVAWKLSRSSDELSASDSRALTVCNLVNILMSHRGYYSSAFFPLLYSSNPCCSLNGVGLELKGILAGSVLCSIFFWQQRGRKRIVRSFSPPR